MKAATRRELRYLCRMLGPYRAVTVVIIATSFLASLCDGISIGMLIPLLSNIQGMQDSAELPRLLRHATELLAPYPVSTQILLAIALVVTAILLKNLLLGLSIYFGYRVSSGIAADLRMRATALLLDVGLEYHHRTKIGERIEKTLYNTAALEDLTRHAVEMVAQVITFGVLFALLLLLSWKLTLIVLAIGAVFMWLTFAYTRRLAAVGENFAASSRELLSGVHESLSGIQVIKACGREPSQQDRLRRIIERHRRNTLRLNFSNYVVHLLTDVLGAFAIGGLFLVTMRVYAMDSKLLIVLLFPFVYVITRIIPVLKQINMARAVIVSRWPFMRLVYDFLRVDDKPFLKSGVRPFAGLRREIRLENVTFAYAGEATPALRDVSLRLRHGETTAVVGRSGSGKSTLVGLVLRFQDPQEGRVLVDDVPLGSFDTSSYRRRIGVVSQDVFIFNDTVRANIAFGGVDPVAEEAIVEAARRAGADEFIRALPGGYDTLLGDRGVKLSGGERQRISIARAVLRDPEILILDEATSSLDARTEERIHEAIAELGRDRTVIVIAHRLSTIAGADWIVVMKDGRVAEQGRPAELRARGGEFQWLARSATDSPRPPSSGGPDGERPARGTEGGGDCGASSC
ncbi:MAG: ABC transporter ATP-binding protein [Planctomycetes bacterium]|nr:ABC transporter ATP-binding protein [Planctomycetota bacterium]